MTVLLNTTPPEIRGLRGFAWDYKLEPMNATLKAWIISAPWAHPAWHSYEIAVYHLRPDPKFPETKLFDPRATHEVVVFALDPSHPIVVGEAPHILTPANYAEQFHADSDAEAVAYVTKTVQDICDGNFSPDTDFAAAWRIRFPFQNPGRAARREMAEGKITGDGSSRGNSVQ